MIPFLAAELLMWLRLVWHKNVRKAYVERACFKARLISCCVGLRPKYCSIPSITARSSSGVSVTHSMSEQSADRHLPRALHAGQVAASRT